MPGFFSNKQLIYFLVNDYYFKNYCFSGIFAYFYIFAFYIKEKSYPIYLSLALETYLLIN